MSPTIHETLGGLATRHPAASRVFHELGLDFCCGGQRSLADACREKGHDPEDLLRRITAPGVAQGVQRWDLRPLDELIEHLLAAFHTEHRAELPRLIEMAAKVEAVHADKTNCPRGLANHLRVMERSLDEHMQKEEQVLFPLISAGRGPMAGMPVRVMMQEHDDHATNLRRLRSLAHDFVAPEEACGTWRALYLRLNELEGEIMRHMHLENEVLFPRALRGDMGAATRGEDGR